MLSILVSGQDASLDPLGRFDQKLRNMASYLRKNLLLVVVATVISAALFVGIYELVGSILYERWKSAYDNKGDWYQGLTIPSNNQTLMWEYQPLKEVEKWGFKIQTNSHGFRDREHDLNKAPGVRRIAFVGDSVTLGIGVEEESIFVRKFDNAAQEMEQESPIEVLNFSVDGYSATQVLELLRTKSILFMPNEIIYIMCMNDFDFDDASARKILYFRKPRSFLMRSINKIYRSLFEYHDYYFHKNKLAVYRDILQTAMLLREKAIDFRVALIPAFPRHTFEDYPLAQLHEEMKAWLLENDVSVLDFLGPFVEQQRPPRAFARDIYHLNEEGHQFVASGLAETLLSPSGGGMGETSTR